MKRPLLPEGQENIPHPAGRIHLPGHDLHPGGKPGDPRPLCRDGQPGHGGVYETFNNFAAVSPQNPTVFEYFRKQLGRPANDAWVVAPSNGFGLIGESSSHGPGHGAGVILPKRLLAAAMSGHEAAGYDHLLRDNYESPVYAPALGVSDEQLQQMAQLLQLSVADFVAHCAQPAHVRMSFPFM